MGGRGVTHKEKTHDQGIMAETAAEIFLRAKGFKIVERRYRSRAGEIDLIAQDGDYIVFVEVKARPTLDEALFSITPKMRGRISDAAMMYLSENPNYTMRPMRFDVVAVKLPFTIRHMENAWME
jgi:putative endonuclease